MIVDYRGHEGKDQEGMCLRRWHIWQEWERNMDRESW